MSAANDGSRKYCESTPLMCSEQVMTYVFSETAGVLVFCVFELSKVRRLLECALAVGFMVYGLYMVTTSGI